MKYVGYDELKGKVVVITGGGGVICSELGKAIAEAGAKVALLDLNEEMANEKAQELSAKGYIVREYKANVLDKNSLKQAHQKILEEMGKCDILINGAGGNNPKATTDKEYYETGDMQKDIKTFFGLEKEGIEFVFNLNLMGTILPTQEFAQDMIEKKAGNILNISSMNAFTPLTKIPAYSGAKAAVSNLTKWLAVHFSKMGIRVNAIAPGFFVTEQNRKLLWNDDGTPTERTGKILAATPMERFGKVDELVGATMLLISDEKASFITGVVLPIDGGFSSYSGV